MIPIYKPYISDLEKQYVNDCLDSQWISSRGKYIDIFEQKLQDYLDIPNAITVSNGTVSIMLAIAALNLPSNSEILCPTLTYSASASPVLWLGHRLVLFDSDYDYQPSFESFYKSITDNTKLLILPELYGNSPKLENFITTCKERDIIILEDSAEVFGSTYKNIHLGTIGDIGSYSFFGNKTITTGEGGLLVCRNEQLVNKIRILKNQSHIGSFVHDGPGFNFRMTNIQAAIGVAQLAVIDMIVKRKKEIANIYRDNIKTPFQFVKTNRHVNSSEWMPLFILPEKISYLQFYAYMQSKEIDTRPCFTPIHKQPNWKYEKRTELTVSELIYPRGFNLPCYPDLTNNQLDYIIDTVNKIFHV